MVRKAASRASAGEDKSGQVQSLTRALALLEAVAESHDGLTLSDLAELTGLPPSTAHRLLTTLEATRFVRFEPSQGLWQVGIQAFVVGNAFVRTRDVTAIARPHMRRLRDECGETVNLYLEDAGEVVCMTQVESRQLMRAIARPGGRVRMHVSGAGKAILAHLDENRLRAILLQHGLKRYTAQSIDSPAKLRAELARIRERGYAIDDEENAVGLRCVAAPILDEHGLPVAAISLSGPTARLGDDDVRRFGRSVRAAARDITLHYGGRTDWRPSAETT
ncbi:MAG: MarR family transcriptional regulator [Geminicoccaceae bacterium]|nr:MAG: MarR family transcriptional regulator [Geminicoccaceae bacterium]